MDSNLSIDKVFTEAKIKTGNNDSIIVKGYLSKARYQVN